MNGLKVEPGGYMPCSARLLSGWSASVERVPVLRIDASTKRLGSNPGWTPASTRRFEGSMATSDPRCSPNACSATAAIRVERQREIVARNRKDAARYAPTCRWRRLSICS